MYLRRRRLCPNYELQLASPKQRVGHASVCLASARRRRALRHHPGMSQGAWRTVRGQGARAPKGEPCSWGRAVGVRRVGLAAAAPCEWCVALLGRRVPVSALAFAAGARARHWCIVQRRQPPPKNLQRRRITMLPSSHPRVATNALQLLSNAVARTPSVGATVARGGVRVRQALPPRFAGHG